MTSEWSIDLDDIIVVIAKYVETMEQDGGRYDASPRDRLDDVLATIRCEVSQLLDVAASAEPAA